MIVLHTLFLKKGIMVRIYLFVILISTSVFGLQQKHFDIKYEPIDVVIPAVEKDLVTLDLCIEGIRKNASNIRRVIVVSKHKLTDKAEWFNEADYPFSFEEVKNALAKDDRNLKEALEYHGRTGWYFQQLLKFYAPFVIPDISSNVLVLDSDTVFLKPVEFMTQAGIGLYNYTDEFNRSYFDHAAKLLPGLVRKYRGKSGVAHHMLLQRGVLVELFKDVESLHGGKFWDIFCRKVSSNINELCVSGASEYEIYYNYIFLSGSQCISRRLRRRNVFRLGDIGRYRNLHYTSYHSFYHE